VGNRRLKVRSHDPRLSVGLAAASARSVDDDRLWLATDAGGNEPEQRGPKDEPFAILGAHVAAGTRPLARVEEVFVS
jgi:hypothetical protein